MAWRLGETELSQRWLTAIRRAPKPTQNFLATIIYRQLRNEIGLLNNDPLNESTIEAIYAEATAWLAEV